MGPFMLLRPFVQPWPLKVAAKVDNADKQYYDAEIKHLIIFGDNDRNGVGQKAAYALASRLTSKMRVEVRIPNVAGTDWNDVLLNAGA